jgi:hypothetical protein
MVILSAFRNLRSRFIQPWSVSALALTKAGPNLGGQEHRELEILTLLTQGISANFPVRHTGNVPCSTGCPVYIRRRRALTCWRQWKNGTWCQKTLPDRLSSCKTLRYESSTRSTSSRFLLMLFFCEFETEACNPGVGNFFNTSVILLWTHILEASSDFPASVSMVCFSHSSLSFSLRYTSNMCPTRTHSASKSLLWRAWSSNDSACQHPQ